MLRFRFLVPILGLLTLACAHKKDAAGDDSSPSGADSVDNVDLVGACEDYIQALNDCVTEASGSSDYAVDAESTCSVYEGVTVDEAAADAAYLDCLTDVYNHSDCSSMNAVEAINTDECTAP